MNLIYYLGLGLILLGCSNSSPLKKSGGGSAKVPASAAINQAPSGATQTLSVVQTQALTIVLKGVDPDGDSLFYSIKVTTQHGTLSLTNDTAVYTPQITYTGSDSFIFEISDGKGGRSTQVVAIQVTSPPNPVSEKIITNDARTCVLSQTGKLKCFGRGGAVFGRGSEANIGKLISDMGTYLPVIDLGTNAIVTDFALGDGHACALLSDKTLKCWGTNSSGELGLGTASPLGTSTSHMGNNLPVVSPGSTFIKIAAGSHHTCGILTDGSVKCWGQNLYGRLGLGLNPYTPYTNINVGDSSDEKVQSLPAVNLGGGKKAKDLALGSGHSCALLTDGSVKCWGNNIDGQLGLPQVQSRGTADSEMGDALSAVDLGTDPASGIKYSAIQLVAGNEHTCALLSNSQVKCWGYNYYGQLGIGSWSYSVGSELGEMGNELPPVQLGTTFTTVGLSAGANHTCALSSSGEAKCWGSNYSGQAAPSSNSSIGSFASEMGNGLAALNFGEGRKVKSLSAGGEHTCVVFTNQDVKCWGSNSYGQLGIGSNSNKVSLTLSLPSLWLW